MKLFTFVNYICKFCEENNFADIWFQENISLSAELKAITSKCCDMLAISILANNCHLQVLRLLNGSLHNQCICVVRWLLYFKLLFFEFFFNISTSCFLFSLLATNFSWPTDRELTSVMLNCGLMFAYRRCCSDFFCILCVLHVNDSFFGEDDAYISRSLCVGNEMGMAWMMNKCQTLPGIKPWISWFRSQRPNH